jgi:hypothetical protein
MGVCFSSSAGPSSINRGRILEAPVLPASSSQDDRRLGLIAVQTVNILQNICNEVKGVETGTSLHDLPPGAYVDPQLFSGNRRVFINGIARSLIAASASRNVPYNSAYKFVAVGYQAEFANVVARTLVGKAVEGTGVNGRRVTATEENVVQTWLNALSSQANFEEAFNTYATPYSTPYSRNS